MKKLLVVLLMFVFSASFAAPYVAVAADGAKPASQTSNTPGKAPFFVIFDENGKFIESLPNKFAGVDGAGPMAVNMLSEKGIKVFAAQSFPGERFVGFLKSKGITGTAFKGTAEAAAKSAVKKK